VKRLVIRSHSASRSGSYGGDLDERVGGHAAE